MVPARALYLGAAAAVGVAACSPFGGGAFQCIDSAACGPGGRCEPTGACSFPDPTCPGGWRYGDATPFPGACVGDEPDAAGGGDGPPGEDAAIDAVPPVPFCDPADPTLRLCLAFEGTAADGAGAGAVVTELALTFAAGQVGMAGGFAGATRVEVAETPALDVDRLTLEAWVRPTTLPGSGRVGIIDDNGEWGLFVQAGGDLRCTPNGGLTISGAVPVGAWTHVACTYDGTTQIVYVDGIERGRLTAVGTLPTNGNQGTSIGGDNPAGPDRWDGLLDQLRVYSEARTPAQICDAAGAGACGL